MTHTWPEVVAPTYLFNDLVSEHMTMESNDVCLVQVG